MPKTLFRPACDGFAFINDWKFDQEEQDTIRAAVTSGVNEALALLSPLFGDIMTSLGVADTLGRWVQTGLPTDYGLCGGMANAALDYFRTGLLVPQGTGLADQPQEATPEGLALRTFLKRRMVDSLSAGGAGVMCLRWMTLLHLIPPAWPFLGGPAWLLTQTKHHWEALKGHLNAGIPWPISLIGETRDPFNNHQVLAYGYEDLGNGSGTLYVYDMNCPGRENSIKLDFTGPALAAVESCASDVRGTLRGFFCNAYQLGQPPDVGLKFGALQKEHSAPGVYLVCGGAKFSIPAGAFNALGYSPTWVKEVPDGSLAPVPNTPVDGYLLRELSTSVTHVFYGGAKFPIADANELNQLGLSSAKIRVVPDGTLAAMPTTPADGTLLRGQSDTAVYVVQNGRRLHVPSQQRLDQLALSSLEIRVVPDNALSRLMDGGTA